MATARKIDENGFLSVRGCPISSYGIFDYSAGQIGLDGDPNRIVKVFRPESEVNNKIFLDSFKNKPFIVNHEMLSGFEGDEAESPDDYGVDGVLTSNVYYEQPWVLGDLQIFSRRAQKAINDGINNLSLGYSCDFELSPGIFDGQPYEVIQKNMRGNHIALVDEARVAGARVLDGLCFDHLNFEVIPSKEGNTMPMNKGNRRKAADNAVEQLKALIPALEQFLNEEAAEPEHQGEGGGSSEGDMTPIEADAGANGGEGAGGAVAGGEGAGEGNEIAALVTKAKAILEQLEASLGNGGAGTDEVEGSENEGAGIEGGDNREGDEHAEGQDAGAEGSAEEGNGKASPGPAAGEHAMAGDSALRRFYADAHDKSRLYDRLSPVVGAFDHARMDAHQVAVYGVSKIPQLKNVKKGTERAALDAYLLGVESANKKNRASLQARRTNAGDSSIPRSDEMDAYLAAVGSK